MSALVTRYLIPGYPPGGTANQFTVVCWNKVYIVLRTQKKYKNQKCKKELLSSLFRYVRYVETKC